MKKYMAMYRRFADKRYSTIAGTLVYFLLMSIAPSFLWLAFIIGRIDLSGLAGHAIFDAIEPFITYLNSAAQSAASGAGVVLLITSLYSSTNFFYHLRRSGEIIYGADRKKGGIKLRLTAAAIVFATIFCVALAVAVGVVGQQFFLYFVPATVTECIRIVFIALISFFIALLLNIFACPYRLGFSGQVCGSLLTTALWLIFAAGFTVYMRFADPSQLYGAAAAIIIFLLWCYVMMNCLVVGMIYNALFMPEHAVKPLFVSKKRPFRDSGDGL